MTLWDHLFFAVVFFVIPFYSWRSYAPWVVDVDARGEPARIAGYRETLSIWFVAAIALIVLWLTTGREWSELGLRLSHPTNFALGAVLGLGLTAFIWWQVSIFVSKVLGGSVTREQLREQIGTTEAVMPGTQREIGRAHV